MFSYLVYLRSWPVSLLSGLVYYLVAFMMLGILFELIPELPDTTAGSFITVTYLLAIPVLVHLAARATSRLRVRVEVLPDRLKLTYLPNRIFFGTPEMEILFVDIVTFNCSAGMPFGNRLKLKLGDGRSISLREKAIPFSGNMDYRLLIDSFKERYNNRNVMSRNAVGDATPVGGVSTLQS